MRLRSVGIAILLCALVGCAEAATGSGTLGTSAATSALPTATPVATATPVPIATTAPVAVAASTSQPEQVAPTPEPAGEPQTDEFIDRVARIFGPPIDPTIPPQERTEVVCLADAVLAAGLEDELPERPSLFEAAAGVSPAMAELAVDCMLTLDLVTLIVTDAGLEPTSELLACLDSVITSPATRQFMIDALTTDGLGGPNPGIMACIAGPSVSDRPSVLGPNGLVDATLLRNHFSMYTGFAPTDSELACVAAAIDDGTIASGRIVVEALRLDPPCISGDTVATGVDYGLTPAEGSCVRDVLPNVSDRYGESATVYALAECIDAATFAEAWTDVEQDPITVPEAECLMALLAEGRPLAAATSGCLEPA